MEAVLWLAFAGIVAAALFAYLQFASKRRSLLLGLAFLPAIGIAAFAIHLRVERTRIARLWALETVIPLGQGGRVTLAPDPGGPQMHAVLVERSDPSKPVIASTSESKAFRWRLDGQAPYRLPEGWVAEGVVFNGLHGGQPVRLHYDVTPVTLPLVERSALLIRYRGLYDKQGMVEQELRSTLEGIAWIVAGSWAGVWALGVRWLRRKRSDPQAAP